MYLLSFLIGALLCWLFFFCIAQRKLNAAKEVEKALQNDLSEAEKRIDDCALKMDNFEAQSKSSTEKLSAADKQIATLKEQLTLARTTADKANKQVQNLQTKLAESEQQKQKLTDCESRLNDRTKALAEGESQIVALQDRLTEIEAKSNDNEKQLQSLQTKLANCQSQLVEKDETVQNLTEKLTKSQTQLSALQQQPPTPEKTAVLPADDAREVDSETSATPDDLRKIEGIGPKIARILNDSEILTFSQLSQTEVGRLKEILNAAGPNYRLADPTSWPDQAALAAKNDWEALEKLQGELTGGRQKS
jgi:chromosome segregation ATPase